MSKYTTIEAYAAHVQSQTGKLLGVLCDKCGPGHPITLAILDLQQEAKRIVQGKQMEAEQADGYDLKALVVNASVPSNSETGWERED